jgi:hypothetical protein
MLKTVKSNAGVWWGKRHGSQSKTQSEIN